MTCILKLKTINTIFCSVYNKNSKSNNNKRFKYLSHLTASFLFMSWNIYFLLGASFKCLLSHITFTFQRPCKAGLIGIFEIIWELMRWLMYEKEWNTAIITPANTNTSQRLIKKSKWITCCYIAMNIYLYYPVSLQFMFDLKYDLLLVGSI